MTPSVCFYFQVHQPYRLRDLRITDIGGIDTYFDDDKNRAIFRKVAEKCYLPANRLMLELVTRHENFRIAYSLSGVFMEQCREYGPDVLDSFRALAATGKVEFLCETYYHSLAALTSIQEFCEQVQKQAATVEELFGVKPVVFRNTELIYSNEVAEIVRLLGFKGVLAEGADFILQGRSPNVPYKPPSFRLSAEQEAIIKKHRIHSKPQKEIKTLLKNYRLSDDVAFRFSDRNWIGFPLHADTFTHWLAAGGGHSINLFMDYETFGEHQWESTGIFRFLEALPCQWEMSGVRALTPSQVIAEWGDRPTDVVDVHRHVSWADMERDLSAWRGNHLQESLFCRLYALEARIKATNDESLLHIWRKLQTSDHFYYLCTKYWSDGDVHKYFSPYDSPYEAFRRLSHAIEDMQIRLAQAGSLAIKKKKIVKKHKPQGRQKLQKKPAIGKRLTSNQQPVTRKPVTRKRVTRNPQRSNV